MDAIDYERLPNTIKMCFPFLVEFKFDLNLYDLKDIEVDFSIPPNCCKFLTTQVYYLRYFTKCEHVKNISTFITRFEDFALVEDLFFVNGTKSNKN